ncbi:hypothetical protein AALP_AAs58904U000700 [Arabis alpina]|uniref:Uncharacterized protein n=1 Tax=Arabis alpina TaxID=50452 RepID=A0A087FZY3_ARAAL|nr:hypothetical protein AALP_AAs58904U000700 [Arabis alpina]
MFRVSGFPMLDDRKRLLDKIFYNTKNTAVAAAEAAEDEALAVFLNPDEILAREALRKIRHVDPTIVIVADQGAAYTHIMVSQLPLHERLSFLVRDKKIGGGLHGAVMGERGERGASSTYDLR